MAKYLEIFFKVMSIGDSFFEWGASGRTWERGNQVQNTLLKLFSYLDLGINMKITEKREVLS